MQSCNNYRGIKLMRTEIKKKNNIIQADLLFPEWRLFLLTSVCVIPPPPPPTPLQGKRLPFYHHHHPLTEYVLVCILHICFVLPLLHCLLHFSMSSHPHPNQNIEKEIRECYIHEPETYSNRHNLPLFPQ